MSSLIRTERGPSIDSEKKFILDVSQMLSIENISHKNSTSTCLRAILANTIWRQTPNRFCNRQTAVTCKMSYDAIHLIEIVMVSVCLFNLEFCFEFPSCMRGERERQRSR